MSSDQSPGESIGRRLWQVILTYTQVWAFRIQIPILILYVIAARWVHPHSMVARGGWGLFAIEQVVVLTVSVADHLKTQLDDWRSALTPGFRWPHLAVATAVAAIPLWIVPMLLKGKLAVSGSGLAALTILIAAILAWAVYSPRITIVVGLSVALIKGGDADVFIADLMAGKLGAISIGMIGAGASALILLWVLLARMDGQTSVGAIPTGNVRFRPKMTMNPRSERTGAIGAFIDRIMERISIVPPPSDRPLTDENMRVRQRRFVTAAGTPPWLAGMSCAIAFVAIFLFLDLIVFMGTGYEIPYGVFMAAVLLPLIQPWLFAATLMQRWPFLARESLLPASRAEFVSQTGRAFFRDLVEGWVSCTIAALLISFAFSPREFISKIGDIGLGIALTAAVLVFAFGISVWLMRFRHQWVAVAELALCMPALTAPVLIVFCHVNSSAIYLNRSLAVIYIAAWCLIGGVFIFDAYYRWCRTELD